MPPPPPLPPSPVNAGIINPGEDVEIIGLKDTIKTTATGVEMFKKLLSSGQVSSPPPPPSLCAEGCRWLMPGGGGLLKRAAELGTGEAPAAATSRTPPSLCAVGVHCFNRMGVAG